MVSADFCPVTTKIPSRGAMPKSRSLPVRSLAAGNSPQRPGLGHPVPPFLELRFSSASVRPTDLPSQERDVSVHKRCIYLVRCTNGLRHEVPARPQTRPSMQFLSVASHVCTPASSGQSLASLPLPSASGYH